MRYGSVCSGIESATVAWYPLGWKASWFSEIKKFPSQVLAHHYPSIENLGDMTNIAEMIKKKLIDAPDIIVGGTPCQAFSVAGTRNSLEDERGQLSLEFVRITNEIDSARLIRGLKPTIVVWENVPGVLNTKDNAFGCFLGALSGEGCELQPTGKKWTNAGCVFGPQRQIAWRVIDAQYFGLPQRRKRVFVVASARTECIAEILFERNSVFGDSKEIGVKRDNTALNRRKNTQRTSCTSANVAFSLIGDTTPKISQEINGTLRSSGGGGIVPSSVVYQSVARSLTEIETERLQGFPDNYTNILGASKRSRYEALGNSMAVPVMKWIAERIQAVMGGLHD